MNNLDPLPEPKGMADPDTQKKGARGFRFALAVVFLDMLGVGIILPVMPLLVGEFVDSAEQQAHWYGLLAATFGVMQFLCMPVLGALSDKIGRRPVLIFSCMGLSLNFLATALAPSLAFLFIGRLIGGACAASISTATAYASDISPAEDRAKIFGKIGATFGIGFLCGPIVGGFLGDYSYQLPFFVAAALCAGNALFGFIFLTESLAPEHRSSFSLAKANPFISIARLFLRPDIAGLIVVFALTSLAQSLLQICWVLYTHLKFQWGPLENGISLFVVGGAAAVVQAVLLSRLIARLGEVRLLLLGSASSVLAYCAYGLATAGWMMYVIVIANILAFAAGPALQGYLSRETDKKSQGALMGSLQSLASVAIVISTIVGTQVIAVVAHYPAGDWRMGAPFFLAAILQLGSFWIAWRYFRKRAVSVKSVN